MHPLVLCAFAFGWLLIGDLRRRRGLLRHALLPPSVARSSRLTRKAQQEGRDTA
jgi:hypothetical protein